MSQLFCEAHRLSRPKPQPGDMEKPLRDFDSLGTLISENSSIGPRGVTVSTLDSESSDRGSNPREAFSLIEIGIGIGTSDKVWGLQSG